MIYGWTTIISPQIYYKNISTVKIKIEYFLTNKKEKQNDNFVSSFFIPPLPQSKTKNKIKGLKIELKSSGIKNKNIKKFRD